MRSYVVVCLLVTLAITLNYAEAADKCYVCSTLTSKDCGDPWKKGDQKALECSGHCMKVKTTGTVDSVTRSCATGSKDGCEEQSAGGNTVTTCFCKGNLCNGGTITGSSFVAMFIMLFLALLF